MRVTKFGQYRRIVVLIAAVGVLDRQARWDVAGQRVVRGRLVGDEVERIARTLDNRIERVLAGELRNRR
jgi:hypothetical protein